MNNNSRREEGLPMISAISEPSASRSSLVVLHCRRVVRGACARCRRCRRGGGRHRARGLPSLAREAGKRCCAVLCAARCSLPGTLDANRLTQIFVCLTIQKRVEKKAHEYDVGNGRVPVFFPLENAAIGYYSAHVGSCNVCPRLNRIFRM